MRYLLPLVLLVASCGPATVAHNAAQAPAAAPAPVQYRVLLLRYSSEPQREAQEARLNALLDQGWAVESTFTQCCASNSTDAVLAALGVEWNVTVVLTRPK